ncbi:hypothetical protein [Mangrovihabitans endophyticus]|uniref:Uncharacterized protein n=1 Tax=Mangrovihabitans endophyticus TaxID=1751298 RepID=A0A8J3C318_9ACTN|nr:hypothetical protein [Mangrovihabitans endophyticus]GGL00117.1 hypothetical protein GCM10012284_38160 [Mangrovihabitans endophyticus]
MHRAAQALIVGGTLLVASACGLADDDQAAPAPPNSAPSVDAAIRDSCTTLGEVFNQRMAPFAQALSTMVDKSGDTAQGRQKAKQALTAFATDVRRATRDSDNPELRADGARTADKLQAKADDPAFFRAITTSQDVSTVLGNDMTTWLSPVKQHCS